MQEINITQVIIDTINTLCSNLFSSIDNSLYPILDDIVFINKDILKLNNIENILGANINSGFLLIANSLCLGIILYYSVKLLFSYNIGLEIERPFHFIFKIIIFIIIMNFSYFICEQIINLISLVSLTIREVGENLFNKEICFASLITELNSTLFIEQNNFNIFTLDGLLKSIISFGLFNLILSYALRYVMIKVFVLIAPFAFLSLINKSTDWFFKSWFKTFLSLLFIQVLSSIIMLICFSVNESVTKDAGNIFNKLILLGAVYALIKANDYIKQFMGGISTTVQTGISNIQNSIGMR